MIGLAVAVEALDPPSMAAFPQSHHDPPNITVAPSPLLGIREHETAPSLFPTRGSYNLVHASKVFPKRVPLYLLKKITNDFSEDRELGTGAYGKVYKVRFKRQTCFHSHFLFSHVICLH